MEGKKENPMKYTFLGNTGMQVPRISLGTMTFRDFDKEDDYFQIVKHAYESGITMFDTAELYGEEGAAEILTGKCLKRLGAAREDLVITVKVFWGPDRKDPR